MADLSGRTFGEFSLRELITEGGGGAVYRGFQPSLGRDIVVKVLREPRRRNEAARERFLREAQLASRLDHPYAAHVYASGAEPDGLLWIAMELVPGVTLDEWLSRHGPMPPERLVPFLERVAAVVDAAHERGIVHRDLKPSNVMVIEHGPYLIPKLLDFGIAKVDQDTVSPPQVWPDGSLGENQEPGGALGEGLAVTRTDPLARQWHLTPSRTGIGSSFYMSPEQWMNASAVGPASDIYALGVVVYKALTGRVPFDAKSEHECCRLHLEAEVPPLGGDFSPNFDRVISRALAKTPEARHASALELASELREALRSSEREMLRSSARQWAAHARDPGLLLGGAVLDEVDRWTRRAPEGAISDLECSFVAASRSRARRSAWLRRSLFGSVLLAISIAVGALHYQSVLRARHAEELVTQSKVEQGRQALLHWELADARLHLTEAYRRGDRSPGTAFMLSRALEPRRSELARLGGTSGRMWSSAFSPNGKQIVATDDRNAQVFDAATGRRLHLLPHEGAVYSAVYSPGGEWLATASGEGVVRLWDAESGELVRSLTREGRRPHYYIVVISGDRRFVAAVTMTGESTDVWDAETGESVAVLKNPEAAAEYPALAFSADGRYLATSGGGEARVFDTRSWQTVLTLSPRVRSLAFDPRASRIVVGTALGGAAIWSVPGGARERNLREVGESVDRIAWSPDGALIAAGSRDGSEQVFDAASGTVRSQGNFLHGRIRSIEFDPTSKLVLAAGAIGSVVISDAALGIPVSVLDGPRGEVRVARFDPNGRRVVGASWDGTARVWDATPPYQRWHSTPIADECGIATSLEPDRRFVAIGCESSPTRVWDTAQGMLLAELPGVSPTDGDFAPPLPAVSAAGELAAVARGNAVELYALPSGSLVRRVNHGATVTALAFASAGRDLVSGASDGSVFVTREGRTELALPLSRGGIDAVAILSDGRVVASDARRRLHVYAAGGETVLADLEIPTRVGLLRPSEDGRVLVTISSYLGETAPPSLWDLRSYRLITPMAGHIGRVFTARFVRSGREVLTAGGDATVRSWDAATGQLRATYRGGSRYLADAALTPDGTMVVSGGGDGLLRYWDAMSARPLWTMQAHKSIVIGVHYEGDDIVTRGYGGDVARWTVPKARESMELSAASAE